MAVPLVETLRSNNFPRASGPAFWHEGAVIPLCERAIATYCSQNGIQRLQEVIDCDRDTRLMAVGACALAAVMLQRSDGQVPDNDPKWEQSVPFAEHLGFVVCNLGPDNKVENGSYPYTMPPGLTLVALWLMRIPWVFLADWSSLETQAALQQTLRVAVASLSFEARRPSKGAPPLEGLWPSALRRLEKFPVLVKIEGPTSILPVQWSSDTGPRLDPASGSNLAKVIVAADFPTLEQTTPSINVTWTPRPLISVPLAAAPDVYGHRCFVQCKFSFPTDPSNGLIADLEEEVRKAGLLKAPSDTGDTQAQGNLHLKQRLTCDLMLDHWRACERDYPALRDDLKPPDAGLPSTAFDRYMYPLCELTAGLVGKKFTTWSTRCSDAAASEAAASDRVDDQGESHGTLPRPSTQAEQDPAGTQQPGGEWVEFRFVVTSCVRLRISQNCALVRFGRVRGPKRAAQQGLPRVLAIYQRVQNTWEMRTMLDEKHHDGLEAIASQLRVDCGLQTVAVSFTITHGPSPGSAGNRRGRDDAGEEPSPTQPRPAPQPAATQPRPRFAKLAKEAVTAESSNPQKRNKHRKWYRPWHGCRGPQ
jgi:hypothetical protein